MSAGRHPLETLVYPTRDAVHEANREHDLVWWLWRWMIRLWQWLFLDPPAPPPSDPVLARGHYLVDALGHCGECHTPTMNNGRPGVVPVTIVSRHMEQGWFDHKAHSQEECSSCHAAAGSTTSADLLLPGIKQCRTCHLGPEASEAKVPSGCAMCHSYHPEPFGKLAEN